MERTVVCDASPLIVLAKAGYLHLLRRVFQRVMAPQSVLTEILAGPPDDPARICVPKLPDFEIVHLEPELSPLAHWRLGKGETEVIEYARLYPGTVALLDDLDARKTAMALGVPVLGTLGLIARALRDDPELSFKNAVERLRDVGLRIDNHVITKVINFMENLDRGTPG